MADQKEMKRIQKMLDECDTESELEDDSEGESNYLEEDKHIAGDDSYESTSSSDDPKRHPRWNYKNLAGKWSVLNSFQVSIGSKRCLFCDRSRDRKVISVCSNCGKHVCKEHREILVYCIDCKATSDESV